MSWPINLRWWAGSTPSALKTACHYKKEKGSGQHRWQMLDPRDISNVVYNARKNRCHPPTSPSIVPEEKWLASLILMTQCAEQQHSPSNLTKYCACHAYCHAWLMPVTYETSFTMRGATGLTLEPHEILRLPRKIALQTLREICRKQLKFHLLRAAGSTMIRVWPKHRLVISHPPGRRGCVSRFGIESCIENYTIDRILRLPRKLTLQHRQILRLRRKSFSWLIFFSHRSFLAAMRSKGTGPFYWAVSKHRLLLYWPISRCAFGGEGISPADFPLPGWETTGRHSWAGVGEEVAEGW